MLWQTSGVNNMMYKIKAVYLETSEETYHVEADSSEEAKSMILNNACDPSNSTMLDSRFLRFESVKKEQHDDYTRAL